MAQLAVIAALRGHVAQLLATGELGDTLPLEVLRPECRDDAIAFLTEAFGLAATAPFVEQCLMRWKYDDPRPGWQKPRGYAWIENGRIEAMGCLCPVTYRIQERDVLASYVLDWAANPKRPGRGVLLIRELAVRVPVLMAVGGSAHTKQILPKLGYQLAGSLSFFVKVVRPWRQFRTDPFPRGWKAPLRFGRNILRSQGLAVDAPPNWTCSPTSFTDDGIDSLLGVETELPSSLRSRELMEYFLRCPGAVFSAFVLKEDGDPRGWFVLSRLGRVVRIADLRIQRPTPEDWRAAYSLATKAALAEPDICEVVATACAPSAEGALRRNGFRFHHSEPVVLLDPMGLLLGHAPLEVTLLESDGAFITDPNNPYLS